MKGQQKSRHVAYTAYFRRWSSLSSSCNGPAREKASSRDVQWLPRDHARANPGTNLESYPSRTLAGTLSKPELEEICSLTSACQSQLGANSPRVLGAKTALQTIGEQRWDEKRASPTIDTVITTSRLSLPCSQVDVEMMLRWTEEEEGS